MKLKQLLIFVILGLAMISCKKENYIRSTDARISFSENEIHFDTVFTSTGSTTRYFKVFNDNDAKLLVDEIRLAGGSSSPFKININGIAASSSSNITLEANDSLYVFVTVHINPTNNDHPFVIEDSISIAYNGNERWIKLEAWGQDANFIRSAIIEEDITWKNTKPYVILGGLTIKEGSTLKIQEGTRIYCNAKAPIIVEGTLLAEGDHYDSTKVIFQSDRLDEPYRSFPGSWPGIIFRPTSMNNRIQFAEIRNAYNGIAVEGPSSNGLTKLLISETIIDNCMKDGIIAIGSSISASNLLISNCGKGIEIIFGGNHYFNHCTVAAVSNNYVVHKEPGVVITDFASDGNNIITNKTIARFENCIIWGSNGIIENEVVINRMGADIFDVGFEHCLINMKQELNGALTSNNIYNEDPAFLETDAAKKIYDFHLSEYSAAIDKGKTTMNNRDLDYEIRDLLPDIGCFEKK